MAPVASGSVLRAQRDSRQSSLGRRWLAKLGRAASSVTSARACLSFHELLSLEELFVPYSPLFSLSNSYHTPCVRHINSCFPHEVLNSCKEHGMHHGGPNRATDKVLFVTMQIHV